MPPAKIDLYPSPQDVALFFDCDGTLAEIVREPQLARVKPEIIVLVERLASHVTGALAIVSGRSISQLDSLFAPLHLPVAGVHGAERRTADGTIFWQASEEEAIGKVSGQVALFAETNPGLIFEQKPVSAALHYRVRPELEGLVRAFAQKIANENPGLHALQGKMVVEISASSATKGDAVRAFMKEAPFSGRRPIFVGDDMTDEDGFQAVNELNGVGIKIGSGPTLASLRVDDLGEFHAWLNALAARWEKSASTS
jgi:trehalose 6-phosphate phosphatase